MMQLANSTFYMSGAEARLATTSPSSTEGGLTDGPSTAAVIRLRKSENPRRTSSRASVGAGPYTTTATAAAATEEEVSPDETAQSSSSAPISPTLSPSSRVMLKRKQLNASLAIRSHPFSTSPSACSTSSSSAASSLVSFGSSSSKSSSLKRGSPEEANLASRLRNLQISELIDAILLVEGKLKKEKKMIAREIRSRDLQISQQLKEIERYRQERKQNLCGFCQKKMDNVSSCGGGGQLKLKQLAEDRVTQLQSVEVQTEEWQGFGKGCAVRKEVATNAEEAAADDDWYANGNSDNENEKSPVSLYERGVNPVLERVNQILLQESMDTSTDEAAAASTSRAATTTTAEIAGRAAAPLPHSVQQQQQIKLAERMQTTRIPEIRKASSAATTAPIGKCAPILVKRSPHKTLSSSSPVRPPMLMRAHSSPVSSKENEYEVIGSEQDSSNYYMEMQSPVDAKSFLMAAAIGTGAEEVEYKNVLTRKEGLELLKLIAPHAGQPPALPPKPANLMKFKKVIPPTMATVTTAKIVTAVNATQIAKSQMVKSAPEPDYCSISECGANNNRSSSRGSTKASNSIVGDVEETVSSKGSEDTLENIIKLPNVAAIIVPKNSGSSSHGTAISSSPAVIIKDNYVTKSVMSVKPSPVIGGGSMGFKTGGGGLNSPKGVKESPSGVLKDLPPMSGGEMKRFGPSSPLRSSGQMASIVERRQNLIHRLSVQQQQQQQHSHHGLMMKRYSMDALSPQIQPEEVKGGSSGLFEERIPIQAEFDWYNLDAEFGKFNAQDVIKENKSSGSESGSVSGGDEERRRSPPSKCKMALDKGLGELKDLERKMTTLERKRAMEQRKENTGGSKELVHFC